MTLAPDSFAFVADVVRQRSAIQLDLGKEYLVESRLLPIVRERGLADVDAYVRGLRARPDRPSSSSSSRRSRPTRRRGSATRRRSRP